MSAGMQHTTNQSIKSFKSSEEYLYAMKEDLAEWLRDLYDIDIDVNNILETLETGAVLCSHANNVTRVAGEFIQKYGMVRQVQLPTTGVTFVNSAQPATFLARDNIANFINWCRKQMDVKDVLMFETEDLVLRKNEKNFVLCLLEVARRASRFGMAAPVLIQLEEEIEEEIREELDLPLQETPPLQKPQRRTSNTQNLDEMVQHLISCCTCPTQFPMVKVSEGKYRVGDSSTLIFVRILRNHVMVRVGGGWDTLEHYLDKHDPCRCTSISHKLAQRPATPVHEIKGRLALQPDGPGRTQPTTFLLSRHAQIPLQPILWTPSAPSSSRGGGLRPARARASPSPSPDPGSRIQDPGPRASFCPSRGPKSSISPGPSPRDNICNQGPGLRRSGSPNYGPRPFLSPEPGRRASRELNTPSPSRLRPPTPTRQHSQSESHHDSSLNSTTRTGRAATRSSPGRSLTNSLPRAVQRPSTPQPQPQTKAQPQRPKTPLVFHRPPGQLSIHPQPQHQHQPKPESHLTQTWTKSQFASKLRQTSSLSANSTDSQYSAAPYRQEGSSTARPATPIRGYSPSKYTPVCPRQPTITVQEPKVGGHSQGNPDLIRTFSPVKKSRDNSPGEAPVRAFTSMGGNLKEVQNKTCTPDNTMANPSHSSLNGDHRGIQGLSKQNAIGLPINHKASHKVEVGVSFDELDFQDHLELPDKLSGAGDGEMDKGYIFTPPPISPAQEASLYQSLEHEILANLQQLSMDSDDSHSNVTDDCTEISQYKPSETVSELEHGRFKMDSVGSKSSPLNQKLSSKAAATNSSLPSEAGYDTVITELSKGKRLLDKVCVESWVNTLSGSSRSSKMAKNRKEVDSGLNLEVTQPCVTNSWSSLGSSVESKELPADSKSHRHSRNRVSISRRRPEANSTAVSPRAESTEPESQKKPRVSSFRQRRALKKPERVPSIYKLKLRPRVLPRHDYRPGKKPSRIPTPLSYRGNPPVEDPGGSSMDTHTRRQAGHSNTSHRQADRGRQGSTERDQRIETCRQPGYEATVRPTQCQTPNQDITDDTEYWV